MIPRLCVAPWMSMSSQSSTDAVSHSRIDEVAVWRTNDCKVASGAVYDMAVHAEYALVIGGMRPPALALLFQPIGRHAGPLRR